MCQDIFCNKDAIKENILLEDDTSYILIDEFPACVGYLLVIPKKHYGELLSILNHEYLKLMSALRKSIGILTDLLGPINYNIVYCEGKLAGQGIDHVHWHIIPRKENDGITIDLNEGLGIEKYKSIKNEFLKIVKG